MRWACVNGIVASVTLSTLVPAFGAAAAEPGSVGRQQRQQAAGWLQLKQDQKTYREGVEPLEPREAANLDRLERRQRDKAHALERRQEQSRNTDGNLRRGAEVERPWSLPNEQEGQRQLDRQRLDMHIQRETLRRSWR